MGKEKDTPAPIQQSVHVDCPVEDAFRLFTERFTEWWPGEDSEQDAVERGSVTSWDPPRRIEFTWHPEAAGNRNQTVNVEFRVEADGTRVTLTHCGWHSGGVPVCVSQFARFVCQHALVAV